MWNRSGNQQILQMSYHAYECFTLFIVLWFMDTPPGTFITQNNCKWLHGNKTTLNLIWMDLAGYHTTQRQLQVSFHLSITSKKHSALQEAHKHFQVQHQLVNVIRSSVSECHQELLCCDIISHQSVVWTSCLNTYIIGSYELCSSFHNMTL
jgi:hypothetical protein